MKRPDWLAVALLCLWLSACIGHADARTAEEIVAQSNLAMVDVAADFRVSGHMAIFLIDSAGWADTLGPTSNLPDMLAAANAYIDMAERSPYTSPQYFERGHVYSLHRTSDDRIIPEKWQCQSLDSYQVFRASVFGPWSYLALMRAAKLYYIDEEDNLHHLAGEVSGGIVLGELGLTVFPMFDIYDPTERDHIDVWIDTRDYYVQRIVITRPPGKIGGQPDPGGRLEIELNGFRKELRLSVPEVKDNTSAAWRKSSTGSRASVG